jgi:hypothetical protein
LNEKVASTDQIPKTKELKLEDYWAKLDHYIPEKDQKLEAYYRRM